MTSPVKIAVHGAAGRMGCRLIALAADRPHFELAAALESPESPHCGADAGVVAGIGEIGLPIRTDLEEDTHADVVIDFSVPAATASLATRSATRGTPLIVATTSLSPMHQEALRRAADQIPIVWSPNTSLAVNLVMKLCHQAATALAHHPGGVDVEIIEWHHRGKEDAPSGTALQFAEEITSAMGQMHQQHGRVGRIGQRPTGEIGFHAVRAGDHPGEHRILFGMPGESIELRVAATSRDAYAEGALVAARWIVSRPPGLYGMQQVLGLTAEPSASDSQ
jgi:4-hydroxy-tetrahydrodipicolinate reductase